jgi:hypothetical protein
MADPNTQSTPVKPGIKPYIALSFAPLCMGSYGQLEWDFDNDIVTKFSEKNKLGKPFEIHAGKYYVSLKVLKDEPIEVKNSDGSIHYSYLHEKWHMEPDGKVVADKSTIVDIRVVPSAKADAPTYIKRHEAFGTSDGKLQMGVMDLRLLRPGEYPFTVMGKVHFCFWNPSEENWIAGNRSFKERSGHLVYPIHVMEAH